MTSLHEPDLSFTVTSFVRELALGWHKLGLYNEGHPARAQVANRVHAVLVALLAPRGTLALGVTRNGFLGVEDRIEGGAVIKLATALFDRSVGVLRFEEGATLQEIQALLDIIPRARVTDDEQPLWERVAAGGITHVQLEPIDFTGIVAVEGAEGAPPEVVDRQAGERLFESILEKLIGNEEFSFAAPVRRGGGGDRPLGELLTVVEKVLDRHGLQPDASLAAAPAEAAAAVGRLGQLLGAGAGIGVVLPREKRERAAAARYVGELLGALPEALRDSVLDGAMRELVSGEHGEEVADVARSVPAAQLVASLRRLRGEQVKFSTSVVGLLEQLVGSARAMPIAAGAAEGEALTASLRAVFAEQDVDRVLPSRERRDRVSLLLRQPAPPALPLAELEPRLETLDDSKVVLSLAQTMLTLVQRPIFDEPQREAIGRRIEQVTQTLLAAGHLAVAARMLQGLRSLAQGSSVPVVRDAAAAILLRLASPGTAAALIEALSGLAEAQRPLVQEVITALGEPLIRALLLALSEETDLGRRRQTFDLLGKLGDQVVPHALALFDDPRWYTTRNMLALLRQGGHAIPVEALRRGLEHVDARVRHEAAKCLGAAAAPVPAELLRRGLEDEDGKTAEAVATAIGAGKLETGRPLLRELVGRGDPLGRQTELRVKALLALGELGHAEDLEAISHLFRRFLPMVSAEERRAAFASLGGYPAAARQPFLERGLKHSDPKVREACERIVRNERRRG